MGFSTTIENHPLKIIVATIVTAAGITWAVSNTFQVKPLEREISTFEKQIGRLEGALNQYKETSQSANILLSERIIELQGKNSQLEVQNSQLLAENKENRSRLTALQNALEESNRTKLILDRIRELEKKKDDLAVVYGKTGKRGF